MKLKEWHAYCDKEIEESRRLTEITLIGMHDPQAIARINDIFKDFANKVNESRIRHAALLEKGDRIQRYLSIISLVLLLASCAMFWIGK